MDLNLSEELRINLCSLPYAFILIWKNLSVVVQGLVPSLSGWIIICSTIVNQPFAFYGFEAS